MQGPGGMIAPGTQQGQQAKSGSKKAKQKSGGGSGGSGKAAAPQGVQPGIPQATPPQVVGLQGITPQGVNPQGGIPPINRTSPQQYLEALRARLTPTQLIAQTVPQAGVTPQGLLPNIPPANPQGLPGGFTSIPQTANPFAAIDTRIGSGLGTINSILQLGGIRVPV